MGLLSAADLSDICDLIYETDLAHPPDRLFFGFANEVVARVASNDLRQTADALNRLTEPSSDGYFLAMWLRNCEREISVLYPMAAQDFANWADQVDAIEQTGSETTLQAADIFLQAKFKDEQSAMIARISQYIVRLDGDAQLLTISKRAHEILHRIQVNGLPILRLGKDFDTSIGRQLAPMINTQLDSVRLDAQSLRGEVEPLPAESVLALEVRDCADKLAETVVSAKQHCVESDAAAFKGDLFEFARTIKQYMRAFAAQIDVHRGALNIADLLSDLSTFSTDGDADGAVSEIDPIMQTLIVLAQDLTRLAPLHNKWQSLDEQLWWLEENFEFLATDVGALVGPNFEREWERLQQELAKLAGKPQASWLSAIMQARDIFLEAFPIPMVGPPTAQSAERFGAFVLATRAEFRTVDQRMRATCNNLSAMTSQLERGIR